MKTRAKGTRIRRKCRDLLESLGILVDVVEKTGKFNKETDLWGLFDLCGITTNGLVYFVQVTCRNPHTSKKFQDFTDKYGCKHIKIQQYVWIDRTGWILYDYIPYEKYRRLKLYE